MIFKQFRFDSPEYKQSLLLREQVLRQPLGLSLSKDDLSGEEQQLHFGLFESSSFKNNEIVAVVLFKPASDKLVKLRQMAVSSLSQGKGLGRHLVNSAELDIAKLGYTRIEMAARDTAIDFYRSLGYHTLGDKFKQVGITHVMMAKDI